MEKLLFIYQLIKKQKENNQQPTKTLNIALSSIVLLIIIILTGNDVLGFMLAKDINGIDLFGILGITYGVLNLVYSIKIKYSEPELEVIAIKKEAGDSSTILPRIKYETIRSNNFNPLEQVNKESKIEEKQLISENDVKSETPVEVLEDQLKSMDEDAILFETIEDDALTLSNKEKQLEDYLKSIL